MKENVALLGDCLELMKDIPDGSIDAIICDPPYGTTSCKWDSVIPFALMWEQLNRVIKPNGAIVLTASQPFTTALIASNIKMFKYELIWKRSRKTGHIHAKNKPLKEHENVLVFSKGNTLHKGQSNLRMNYNPQGLVYTPGKTSFRPSREISGSDVVGGWRPSHKNTLKQEHSNYPTSILEFSSEHNVGNIHPTQKPVALWEYLIKTYTNEGELVLDFTAGSHTTAIACLNTNRQYICIEKEEKYHKLGLQRIANHAPTLQLATP